MRKNKTPAVKAPRQFEPADHNRATQENARRAAADRWAEMPKRPLNQGWDLPAIEGLKRAAKR